MVAGTPWWRAQFTKDTWRRALYVLLSAVLGVLYCAVVLLGLGLALYTMLVAVGVVVLAGTLALARRIARWERARARALLGLALAEPAYREPRRPGPLRRLAARLRDPQRWKDVAYALLGLPLGALCLTVASLLGALVARAAVYPFAALAQRTYPTDWGGPTYLGAVALHTGQGLVVLFVLPLVLRGLSGLQARAVRGLLAGRLDPAAEAVDDGADGNLGAPDVDPPMAR